MPHLTREGIVVAYFVAVIGWLTLIRVMRNAGVATLLMVAIVLRLPLLSGPPSLSPDLYRYLWDGRVSLAGINPYRYAPDHPSLRELRDQNYAKIKHREVRSVYPPWAQMIFLGWAALDGSFLIWRLLIMMADLAIVALLARHAGALVALAYATCPLIVVEGVWNGHLDALAGALFLAALVGSRSPVAGALLGIAAGIKLVPVAAAPVMARRSLRLTGWLLVFALVPPIAYLFSGALMTGLGDYAKHWSFNSPLFELTRGFVEGTRLDVALKVLWAAVKNPLGLEPISDTIYRYLYPDFIARVILFGVFAAGLIAILRRRLPVLRGSLWAVGLLILCSPTIHPWYWLTIAPLALACRSRFWIALAVASPISYLAYMDGAPRLAVSLGSYVPALAIGAVQAISVLRERDISRWMALRGESPS